MVLRLLLGTAVFQERGTLGVIISRKGVKQPLWVGTATQIIKDKSRDDRLIEKFSQILKKLMADLPSAR